MLNCLYYSRTVMNQQSVLVAALEDPPYITYDAAKDRWNGIFVVALNAVCARIKYNCTYFRVPELGLAEMLDGPMGAVISGSADVGVIASKITKERFQHLYFIPSLMNRTYSVIIHKNHIIVNNSSGSIFQAVKDLYSTDVWCAIFVVLFCSVGVLFFIEWFYASSQNTVTSIPNLWTFVGLRFLRASLGAGEIGGSDPPRNLNAPSWWPHSKRVFLATWLLYNLTISSTLIGRLAMIFSLEVPQTLPFTDAKSLAASDFRLFAHGESISEILKDSKTFAEYPELMARLTLSPSRKNKTFAYLEELARNGRNAIILSDMTFQGFAHESCNLFVAIEAIAAGSVACLVMPKNFTLAEKFLYGYARITEEGIVQAGRLQLEAHSRNASRPRPGARFSCFRGNMGSVLKGTESDNMAFTLADLSAIFHWLCYALGLSACVFVCEIFVRHGYYFRKLLLGKPKVLQHGNPQRYETQQK